MCDRELLELAAKAAGIALQFDYSTPISWSEWRGLQQRNHWNPLVDDADAFRLHVKLRIAVSFLETISTVSADRPMPDECPIGEIFDYYETFKDEHDIGSATRRAIVRAAAEIGKSMQEPAHV